MNAHDYIEIRSRLPIAKVTLGYTTVTIFSELELEEAQVGYSVSDSGERFTGVKKGDWKESWLVIGTEDLCGDPIFVDLNMPDLPVFTAAHGQGEWIPVMIAGSFEGFGKALGEIERISDGRQNPVQLQRNPLPVGERERVLSRIAELNPNAELEFWESWFSV
jgi:hypothetical protein